MKKSLSESLNKFYSASDSFDDPYSNPSETESVKSFIKEQKEEKKGKRKSKKKDSFERISDQLEEIKTYQKDLEEDTEDFDTYLQDFMIDDEDSSFRNDLIQRGRKYARDTTVSRESSELQKLYAGNEKRLEELIREVAEDNEYVKRDIMNLRSARSRNYKALAELIGERRGNHDTTLSAIKELNSMVKSKVELQLKLDKEKSDEGSDSDIIANKAIQNIFSMGRGNLIGSYADVSGSLEAGAVNEYDSVIDEDKLIHDKFFKEDEDLPESDGDKFLKYEDVDVQLVLEYDDNGPIRITAEDRDGNELPDYPTIALTDDMTFDLSESTGTATDNLSQKYILRKL